LEGHKPDPVKPVSIGFRYWELSAAFVWGLTPYEWDGRPVDERAEMMAYHEVKSLIESYRMETDPE
jgi:hypothetical protein